MRPIRLEMKGFASFRDRAIVDFEDVDLFVLTGPTGAGKSSVIDAMIFALYGSIPRLDDRRAVAPVISRGMLETRVRLDFAVGESRYTAVRVARATRSGGATTPEARLEDDAGNTLASGPDELTAKVGEILGLSFDHFTKSVVLPQGDFAELLHERPGKRQKMLESLLGTELYTRLATRARTEGTRADVAAQLLETEIDRLENAGISPEGFDAARQREEDLHSLVERIRSRQPEIEALQNRRQSANQRGENLREGVVRLREVHIPEGVAELAENIAEGRRRLGDAREAYNEAVEERQCRQKTLDRLPHEAEMVLILRRYDELGNVEQQRIEAASGLEEAQASWEVVQAESEEAQQAIQAAEHALRSMEDEHRAYHLARGLTPGRPCPVCHQPVSELPELETPEEMERLEEEHRTAQNRLDTAEERLTRGRSVVDRQNQRLEELDARRRGLEGELREVPPRQEIEGNLEQVRMASSALQEANQKERTARERLNQAREYVEALDEEERRAWREYDVRRDRLAEMEPPAADRDDLAAAWNRLTAWSEEQAGELRAQYENAENDRRASVVSLDEIREAIAEWCRDADVTVGDGEEPTTACSRELGQQEGEVARIERALNDLNQRRCDLERRRRVGRVAADLARHLDARNFERWLMAQVLDQLCIGASRELLKLSSGSYSLDLDGSNNFVVVDHRNADERRPVRTLSGGETFLASLSLALALSEHLADLAVGGAAKLESLFLDEGFGTLDMDTLDVVITAIEELGSRGRMVGVVTHVRELADSIPVRYEVTREGNRSSIERIEA